MICIALRKDAAKWQSGRVRGREKNSKKYPPCNNACGLREKFPVESPLVARQEFSESNYLLMYTARTIIDQV